MEVLVRKSKDNEWGVVESFGTYKYIDSGNISVVCCVGVDGKLLMPYAMRNEEFIPLSVIDEELGLERYLKAKKPIYSKLSDGFIVHIKAYLNYETGEFLSDKSVYTVYKVVRRDVESPTVCKLTLEPIVGLTAELEELMCRLSKEIVECRGNRVEFLKSRMA